MTIADEPQQEEFERTPGLFRRWELVRLIEPGRVYRIEDAGATSDGCPIFALYQQTEDGQQGANRPDWLQ